VVLAGLAKQRTDAPQYGPVLCTSERQVSEAGDVNVQCNIAAGDAVPKEMATGRCRCNKVVIVDFYLL
jgi:hypothetical protein